MSKTKTLNILFLIFSELVTSKPHWIWESFAIAIKFMDTKNHLKKKLLPNRNHYCFVLFDERIDKRVGFPIFSVPLYLQASHHHICCWCVCVFIHEVQYRFNALNALPNLKFAFLVVPPTFSPPTVCFVFFSKRQRKKTLHILRENEKFDEFFDFIYFHEKSRKFLIPGEILKLFGNTHFTQQQINKLLNFQIM